MKHNYSQPTSAASYVRSYGPFRGVDFTNDPAAVDFSRSPYAVNVDITTAGSVVKRPTYQREYDMYYYANNQIDGLWLFQPPAAIADHSFIMRAEGMQITMIDPTTGNERQTGLTYNYGYKPDCFQYKDRFYVLGGLWFRVLYYDDEVNDWVCKSVSEVATAPETQIAGYWEAEEYTEIDEQAQTGEPKFKYTWIYGEKGERNLLTNRRINTFCGDKIHKTFYFDAKNFHVYKVEQYAPTAGATTTQGSAIVRSGSNIRKKPSMSGDIVGHTSSATTLSVSGKSGSWYQVIYNGSKAYVHQDRVQTYTPASGGGSTPAEDRDWIEVTSGFTVSEDSAKHCTKIVFDSAPPEHPMGNGIPNIRVTGTTVQPNTVTSFLESSQNFKYVFQPEALAISLTSVKLNGSSVSSSAYTVTKDGEYIREITFSNAQSDDRIDIEYVSEEKTDLDTIPLCHITGRYGQYNNDRFWYTGNKNYPQRDWYSEPSDPTYVMENSYTDIGNTPSTIAGYLNYQGTMLIIKEDSAGENIFRRTATDDGDMVIFPVKAYNGRGAVAPLAMAEIENDAVMLSPEGVKMFASDDAGTYFGMHDVSHMINTRLLREDLKDAQMYYYNGDLYITFSNGHIYVGKTMRQTAASLDGSYGFEWVYWTGIKARHMLYRPENDFLYFGSSWPVKEGDPVSTVSNPTPTPASFDFDGGFIAAFPYGDLMPSCDLPCFPGDAYIEVPVEAQWNTPVDNMDDIAHYKHILARGAVIQFDGSPQHNKMAIVLDGHSVFARAEEGVEDEYYTAADYDWRELHAAGESHDVRLNQRIKHFKTIQFVFRNDSADGDILGLKRIEFQYTYGRYIK